MTAPDKLVLVPVGKIAGVAQRLITLANRADLISSKLMRESLETLAGMTDRLIASAPAAPDPMPPLQLEMSDDEREIFFNIAERSFAGIANVVRADFDALLDHVAKLEAALAELTAQSETKEK